MKISRLSVEITRKCNLRCAHCCRGNSENKNIKYEYIDSLLSQVDEIVQVTFTGGEPSLNVPAIQHFIAVCKKNNVKIGYFIIITNGINIKQNFIDVCYELADMATHEKKGVVLLSNDKYHTSQRMYNDNLLKKLPFYKKRGESSEILREGRGENIKDANKSAGTSSFTSSECFNMNYLTININGEIINGVDFSYNNQKNHYLCRVENLIDFYNQIKIKYDKT